jgi:hypothetical protein
VIKKPVIEAPVIKKPVIEAPVIKETVKETLPGLVEEIETNIKIATQPWISKLLPFQTRVWEGIQDTVNNMPANAQEDLRQTYVDIRLANSIVRLATQFNRRSQSLDDSYQKLCAAIAEKLSKIKPLIS